VLLLLHGWTATGGLNRFACFGPLSRLFRVVAHDLRGHGRGVRSRRLFRLEDCADDAAVLATELGIDRFVPVGYSMGGAVAQLVWHRHPERVEGLVLCATASRFSGDRATDRAIQSGILGLSLAASMSPGTLRRRTVERVVQGRLNGNRIGEWAASEYVRHDPVALLQAGAALGRFDSRAWLETVSVPTAVVVTTADTTVATHSQLALATSIPRAQVFRVDGDHGVCAAAPGRFVPVLSAACQHVARQAGDRSPAC
jgi:3-oxoadipate enol-lactonase